jgi:hypothetical protein
LGTHREEQESWLVSSCHLLPTHCLRGDAQKVLESCDWPIVGISCNHHEHDGRLLVCVVIGGQVLWLWGSRPGVFFSRKVVPIGCCSCPLPLAVVHSTMDHIHF